MALGRALQALTEQKTVIVIQFLKGSEKTGNLEVPARFRSDHAPRNDDLQPGDFKTGI